MQLQQCLGFILCSSVARPTSCVVGFTPSSSNWNGQKAAASELIACPFLHVWDATVLWFNPSGLNLARN